MDRRASFPDFRAAWIVHEDDDVIVVHKPVGVPCQAADPRFPDDLVTRLARFLAARDGDDRGSRYLGVHQRLDKDTSGLLVYAKRREANRGLARQLEGRTAIKTYVAAVTDWPADRSEVTLRDVLARGRDGRMEVAAGRGRRGGKRAVTHLRVIRRAGPRALLAVRIETGRTHQIRAQLAHAGAPVGGDRLYGGVPARRLMLHAAGLTLDHPVTGARLDLEAPVPATLERFVDGEDSVDFGDEASLAVALDDAWEARWGIARAAELPEPTHAFRLVHAGGDGMPGLEVDVYGGHAVAHFLSEAAWQARDRLADALMARGFDGVYVKRHPKQLNVVDAHRADLAPPEPVRGEPAPEELVIRENGMPFVVRLGDGLSTGIFLDQRENRRRVRDASQGADVLNLFAYTCAFTVAAALGGARRTVSIDASAPALARGERNLMEAGVDPKAHARIQADVFEALASMADEDRRFDLVVVDPPTYSSTKRTRWTSGKDWRGLGVAAMRLCAPGGVLLACSNDRRLGSQKLRRYLHDAAREAGREVRRMRDAAPPPDFPAKVGGEPHLKSVWVTLE